MSDDPIRITSRVEKWRFVCPRVHGHKDWRVWDGVFACRPCREARNAGEDVPTTYERLYDTKAEAYVTREEIEVDYGKSLPAAPGD